MNIISLIIAALAGIMCAVGIIITANAFKKGKEIYGEYIEPLDEKEFKMKKYLPAGLYLNEKYNIESRLPKKFRSLYAKYLNKIRGKVGELYGVKYLEYYMEIHSGSKWIWSALGFIGLSAFGLINALTSADSAAMAAGCIVLAPIAAAALPFLADKDLDSKIEERRMKIEIEFPEFVNKLILLVNAGMTIPRAWEKIVTDNTKKSPLYAELEMCMAEISAGVPEEYAYEAFGRRCKIKEVMKFVSVVVLNMRKGGSEVVPVLRQQADECWEMRKATAKRLGEKASSKLMLPIGIMLVGIMMIVLLPAVMSLTGV